MAGRNDARNRPPPPPKEGEVTTIPPVENTSAGRNSGRDADGRQAATPAEVAIRDRPSDAMDTAMANLFERAGVAGGTVTNMRLRGAEDIIGGPIEVALGATLDRLSKAMPGTEDYKAYEGLVTFVQDNSFGAVDSIRGIFTTSNLEKFYGTLVPQIRTEELVNLAMTVANVDPAKTNHLIAEINKNPELKVNLNELVSEYLTAEASGEPPHPDKIYDLLEKNSGNIHKLADNADLAVSVAGSDAGLEGIPAIAAKLQSGAPLPEGGFAEMAAETLVNQEIGNLVGMYGSRMSPAQVAMLGVLGTQAIEAARKLGDGGSTGIMSMIIGQFSGSLTDGGFNGMISMEGDSFMADAMNTLQHRLGLGAPEGSPYQGIISELNATYMRGVDMAEVGENVRNGVWGAKGEVLPEDQRGKQDMTTLAKGLIPGLGNMMGT